MSFVRFGDNSKSVGATNSKRSNFLNFQSSMKAHTPEMLLLLNVAEPSYHRSIRTSEIARKRTSKPEFLEKWIIRMRGSVQDTGKRSDSFYH